MAASNNGFHFFKPHPQSRLRLFCFAYAGGGATIYRSWASLLPPEVEICAIQFPGREERINDIPFTRISPLIDNLTQAIQPYLTKPYAFFGHSMGALVSFELARSLRRLSTMPSHLFASAHRAPQVPDPRPPTHQLSEEKFKQMLLELNGTPRPVLENDELMQMLVPVLRADFAACETYAYTPGTPLNCPITVFGGLNDHEISYADLEAWRVQTRRAFQLYMLEGDHFFFHSSKERILQIVNQELSAVINHMQRAGTWITTG